MSKTLSFVVTIPNIPEGMEDAVVRDWLWDSLLHPYDAAYEASVTVEPLPKAADATPPPPAEEPDPGSQYAWVAPEAPDGYHWTYTGTCSCQGSDLDCAKDDSQWSLVADRANNGCMIYRTGDDK